MNYIRLLNKESSLLGTALFLAILEPANAEKVDGTVTGSVEDTSFTLDGVCEVGNPQYFGFKTDGGHRSSDVDGDGFFVGIGRAGDMWTLMLYANGQKVYTGSPGAFKKESGNSYSFSKKLKRRKQNDEIHVDLKVSCS